VDRPEKLEGFHYYTAIDLKNLATPLLILASSSPFTQSAGNPTLPHKAFPKNPQTLE